MKYACWLILSQNLRDALAISQVALHEIYIRQFRERNLTLLKVCPHHMPTLGVQESHHVGTDEALSSRYECDLSHWSCQVFYARSTFEFEISLLSSFEASRSFASARIVTTQLRLIQDFADAPEQRLSFAVPAVCQKYFLALAHHVQNFARMRERVFDLSCQVARVPRLKEQ